MKKGFALLLVLVLCMSAAGAALGEAELSYDGQVVAGESIPVSAPYGGKISEMLTRGNSWVKAGDVVCEISGTLNYAPIDGYSNRCVRCGGRRSGIHWRTVRRGALY